MQIPLFPRVLKSLVFGFWTQINVMSLFNRYVKVSYLKSLDLFTSKIDIILVIVSLVLGFLLLLLKLFFSIPNLTISKFYP